ncbi:hypothetical protein OGAPHI_005337 [Ogataea philodendri]|uniref:Uncharacterized protein n=2 Tax=Ogataea TaxID=461281 RepID=A0A9P8P185_9ASCO|nr:uncharacterized protein OGAPHI_005337 [Ogataea philodendri]KAH3663347.1 hypothetical protein OGAPHI_005337 [Ogataea philodendri]KAH3674165.1 hypothetical protein OGATHE_001764 [Ogataea polymorpha]
MDSLKPQTQVRVQLVGVSCWGLKELDAEVEDLLQVLDARVEQIVLRQLSTSAFHHPEKIARTSPERTQTKIYTNALYSIGQSRSASK